MNNLGWLLVVAGIGLAALGAIFLLGSTVPWIGRLPGDIRIEGERGSFYFPIVTCLIFSVGLSFLFWIVQALRR